MPRSNASQIVLSDGSGGPVGQQGSLYLGTLTAADCVGSVQLRVRGPTGGGVGRGRGDAAGD